MEGEGGGVGMKQGGIATYEREEEEEEEEKKEEE